MIDFLYTIIIFPLEQTVEICFVAVYRIFSSRVLAVFGVSAAVSIITMPLYFMAEKWQETERETQRRLRPKIERIKAAFSGDGQYLSLAALYRQNHWHPVFALRNSFGILVQVPFFIAAYNCLSRLEMIRGVPFLFIADLGKADGLLKTGAFSVNILPILMTAVNIAASAVYSRGHSLREKARLFFMAALFLVLLYGSPAALVLYWTGNNVFSLGKNIISKSRHAAKIVYVLLCLSALALDLYFIPGGYSPKRLFAAFFVSSVFFIPLFRRLWRRVRSAVSRRITPGCAAESFGTFMLPALSLFLLAGLAVPGALAASSVQEFSFIEQYRSPFPFIARVLLQGAGFFLFWPLCAWFLAGQKGRRFLAALFSYLCFAALLDVFVFRGNWGYITNTFTFSNPDTFESQLGIIAASSAVLLVLTAPVLLLLFVWPGKILASVQIIVLFSCAAFGIFQMAEIAEDFRDYAARAGDGKTEEVPEPVYLLSRSGKNVIVIMLDAGVSGYISGIFQEKPELLEDWPGFTYYPNCVSFGSHTRIGAPPLFGGYEYGPRLIQKGRAFAREKHNEALLMMPRLFSENGWNVTVTDPPFANYSLRPDLSIFSSWPAVRAENVIGRHTGLWLRQHPDLNVISVARLMNTRLIRFSFLKMAPPAFRVFIYDRGDWLFGGRGAELSVDTINNYTALDMMGALTAFTGAAVNTYTAIDNDLPHYPAFFQAPSFTPSGKVTVFGSSPFAHENGYHVNMASLVLLGKWFRFLRENGVWDNTRIIVASDHGRALSGSFSANTALALPGGESVQAYNSILLVKDFDSRRQLAVDDRFMTQADVPFLAVEGVIAVPGNPFTGKPILPDKENGVTITTSTTLQYRIDDSQWLHVHDSIFNTENWSTVRAGTHEDRP